MEIGMAGIPQYHLPEYPAYCRKITCSLHVAYPKNQFDNTPRINYDRPAKWPRGHRTGLRQIVIVLVRGFLEYEIYVLYILIQYHW